MNTCKMNCHACDLQDGIENKKDCAILLMPSMINGLSVQLAKQAVQSRELAEIVNALQEQVKELQLQVKEQTAVESTQSQLKTVALPEWSQGEPDSVIINPEPEPVVVPEPEIEQTQTVTEDESNEAKAD